MAVVQYLVAHSDICTAIGGGTETVGFQFSMRCSEWKTVGKGELERQEPLPAAREVIGEEEIHRIPLVGRKRDALAVELHPGIHQRQTKPGIRAGHKLAIELEVETCSITAAFVLSVINYLYIADRVGHQIAQCLVVGFG